ncbi:hypothetical protein ASE00_06660 [Sphingomonas sp. Root710]|uniref:acyl-CoA dehydrogenase family protein n=1 Tax=Sphingomonas sp. Root710 TaxID=1736594 RepID=UPI0006FF12F4|nr:acyl-CoA dehydrogenase [Sphingomonas sp. Root710]KRB86386.1 hypothetical protein ASE00_06660 [Sphingomonas sp. Root710]
MNFDLSEEQRLLADSLGGYLGKRYDRDAGDRTHWSALAELGVIGAFFDPTRGGFGGSAFDVAVVFEQIGRAVAIEPFLGTLMAGTAMGDDVPEALVTGTELFAFAHQEAALRHDPDTVLTTAVPDGAGWRLTGHKGPVRGIEQADHIVVTSIGPTGLASFLVDPASEGVSIRGYPMIDGGRGGELVLDNTPARLVGPKDGASAIARTLMIGTVALCWEAVGIMDHLRDATLDYMRIRTQFGRAIGSFQVLQHRMADLAIDIEQARSAAINAAAAIDAGRRDAARVVSAAKYTIGTTGTRVAEESIQIHGGIAMTWEFPSSLHAKRLIQIGQEHGDADHHLARFVALAAA